MSKAADIQQEPRDTDDFRVALESVLSEHLGASRRVCGVERRQSEYSSSYMLEEVGVQLDDGTSLQLIFKNLSWRAMLEGARAAKPAFLYDPLREIETYRSILTPNGVSAPFCFGALVEPRIERYWLFLEKVSGFKIRHVGEFSVWQEVARWLASLHTRFDLDSEALTQPQAAHLLRYDRDFFRLWIERAAAFLKQRGSTLPKNSLASFDRFSSHYEIIVERLATLPHTFIHGDFFASNVLAQQTPAGVRVRPVDWEMAGIGPGLIDLAALTSGTWSEAERNELSMAYYEELVLRGRWRPTRAEFLSALDYCRLHLAVQWLGWSTKWSPPADEAQDWLSEALRLAQKLKP